MSEPMIMPEGMPEISEETKKDIFGKIGHFLFFTTIKRGEREYVCTACHKTFRRGEKVLTRTETPADRALYHAKHNSEAVCPLCGEKATVINTKLQKRCNQNIEITRAVVVFFAKSKTEVWARAAFFVREFFGCSGNYTDTINETARYHLTTKGARCWKKPWNFVWGWGGGLYPSSFCEPFQWDNGLQHIAFDYSTYTASELAPDETFIKYSGYKEYCQNHYLNAPFMKYLCWYCEHPQIEMLSKMKHFSTIGNMIYENKDLPTFFNWEAAKPWELYRMSRPVYNEWVRRGKRLNEFKLFITMKGTTEKDLDLAMQIYRLSWNRYGEAKKLIYTIRRTGRSIKDAIKYFEKISRESVGACHHCPGITASEAVDMWIDYIRMSGADKKGSTVSPWPADLKAAHDNYFTAAQLKAEKEKRKAAQKALREAVKQLEGKAEELSKKYKSANKNLAAVKKKYEYDNGTYCFVMPSGIYDVLYDGTMLNQCTARADFGGNNWRYLERINRNETYIGFMRKSNKPDEPWITVEFEPGGTVRQKRAYEDSQPANIMPTVIAFLTEWQGVVAKRLTKSDKKAAATAKVVRNKEFAELRRTGKTVNYGIMRGTLLIDAFEKDLMEIEIA